MKTQAIFRVMTATALIILSLLSSCGGKSEGGSQQTATVPASESKAAKSGAAETPAAGGKINLADNSIYFVVVDGVKYGANTAIQKILDDGFTARSKFDRIIDAGKYSTSNTSYWEKGEKSPFATTYINRSDKPVALSACTLYEITVNETWYKNVSILGGITFGNSVDDVEKVFGTDNLLKTTRKQREEMTKDLMPVKGKDDVIMIYEKPGGNRDGRFTFYFSDEGKLNHISMVCNR
jgi:hypothetical protein